MSHQLSRSERIALRFAKVCITVALPFIMIWFPLSGAIRAAWFEIRATWLEYIDVMRRDQ